MGEVSPMVAELRGMWELPSVVHFAQTFRQQFKLRKFTPDVSRGSDFYE